MNKCLVKVYGLFDQLLFSANILQDFFKDGPWNEVLSPRDEQRALHKLQTVHHTSMLLLAIAIKGLMGS